MMSFTSRRYQDYQQKGSRPWENQQRWQFSSSPPLWNRLAGEIQVQTWGRHIQEMFALKSSWSPRSELNLCKEWRHSLVLPGIETTPTLQSVLIIHILGHVWLVGERESCIEYSSKIFALHNIRTFVRNLIFFTACGGNQALKEQKWSTKSSSPRERWWAEFKTSVNDHNLESHNGT